MASAALSSSSDHSRPDSPDAVNDSQEFAEARLEQRRAKNRRTAAVSRARAAAKRAEMDARVNVAEEALEHMQSQLAQSHAAGKALQCQLDQALVTLRSALPQVEQLSRSNQQYAEQLTASDLQTSQLLAALATSQQELDLLRTFL